VVPFARNERSSLFRLIVDVDKKKFFLALTAGFHLCLRFQRKKERKKTSFEMFGGSLPFSFL
jgi:hypothetical protein